MESVSLITNILVDVFLGTLSLLFLSAGVMSFQALIFDRKHEKREQEREKRDAEYHRARMKEFQK